MKKVLRARLSRQLEEVNELLKEDTNNKELLLKIKEEIEESLASKKNVKNHPQNKTGRKSLDALFEHPGVETAWSEGEDGYWVSLRYGWYSQTTGCHSIHEWKVEDVLFDLNNMLEICVFDWAGKSRKDCSGH